MLNSCLLGMLIFKFYGFLKKGKEREKGINQMLTPQVSEVFSFVEFKTIVWI